MFKIIYLIAVLVLISGLFIMITSDNYLRKIIGLGIFQSAVLLFYIALSKIKNGIVPINLCINPEQVDYNFVYSSPLPHVLMLTAIVVGFATMSVGLALIYKIYDEYHCISEDKINDILQSSDIKTIKKSNSI